MIGFFILSGFSQSQTDENNKSDLPQNVLKMRPVQIELDNFSVNQQPIVRLKDKPPSLIQGKLKFVRQIEKTNIKSKNLSRTNAKPKQILNTEWSGDLLPGNKQIYSKSRTTKKLGRVEGYVEREEIKKIIGHTPLSRELFLQALGNPKLIKTPLDKIK